MSSNTAIHFDLDGAWTAGGLPMATLDVRPWGPLLRYSAPRATVEAFYQHAAPQLRPFVLYGSGDFHYLAGLWLRQVRAPVVLISFDNHPDWDIRPPHWGCGGWINRAFDLPHVEKAIVWGCGNFEFNWPWRLFANHAALKSGKLEVHPWTERQSPATQRRYPCMTRQTWQEQFAAFAHSLAGKKLYVTVDLDCLRREDAATNWENGMFYASDVAWALRRLRHDAEVVGGDLCGAYSNPVYARWKQAVAGKFDHPKLAACTLDEARSVNNASLATLWPALTGGDQGNASGDQYNADARAHG